MSVNGAWVKLGSLESRASKSARSFRIDEEPKKTARVLIEEDDVVNSFITLIAHCNGEENHHLTDDNYYGNVRIRPGLSTSVGPKLGLNIDVKWLNESLTLARNAASRFGDRIDDTFSLGCENRPWWTVLKI